MNGLLKQIAIPIQTAFSKLYVAAAKEEVFRLSVKRRLEYLEVLPGIICGVVLASRSISRYTGLTRMDVGEMLVQIYAKGFVNRIEQMILFMESSISEQESVSGFMNRVIVECSPGGKFYVEEMYQDYLSERL